MSYVPRLIVFEGADAVGKNEMSNRLLEAINTTPGRKAKRFSFPRYETPVGRAILRHLKNSIQVREEHTIDSSDMQIDGETVYRKAPEDALVFQCMMVADKYHAANEISMSLINGFDVICDRWWQSAYAFGSSDGLDPKWLEEIHKQLPRGDINILLDLSAEESAERRPAFRDRYETDRAAQQKIRQIYRDLWVEMGTWSPASGRWQTINASRTRDQVFAEVWATYLGG